MSPNDKSHTGLHFTLDNLNYNFSLLQGSVFPQSSPLLPFSVQFLACEDPEITWGSNLGLFELQQKFSEENLRGKFVSLNPNMFLF